VTGGTGFLGRSVVERLLEEGRPVTVFSRRYVADLAERGVRFIVAGLTDTAAVDEACRGMETVFHVAAKVGVWGRSQDFFNTNVQGTRAVVAACRRHGVRQLVFTSTPSVVYNGGDLSGVDETAPLTRSCPCPYPLTKAMAEKVVLEANSPGLRTVALRPHLIWGRDDPHLIPRIIARARAGRLRIVGRGTNRVDLVHIRNAVDAHLLAEAALREPDSRAAGKAYFITNGEPVILWDWLNTLLARLGEPTITRRMPLGVAEAVGVACELLWKALPLRGEPPMTRFVAAELAHDHWFDLAAARRDLGYVPRVSMAEGLEDLICWLRPRTAG
jgi:nucleoside-diphosphate-sugar epimerase